mmetsp:Transcript_49793/g.142460  ORF Transcript_49793/g.142460 Transcript_49793/m.142460 type:complete len:207 (-) Transcript_49793:314-934(-)
MLNLTNKAPPKPPIRPKRQKGTISQEIQSFLGLCLGVDSAKSARFAPVKFRCLSVKLAEKAAMNANSSVWRLNERTEPSSSAAKRTPPRGARNAAETPAAAPMQASWWKGITSSSSLSRTRARCSTWAQHTPMWIIGPSLPSDRPAPSTSARPRVLTSRHRAEKLSGRAKPETAALTSGIPLPRAAGQTSCTISAASTVQKTEERE